MHTSRYAPRVFVTARATTTEVHACMSGWRERIVEMHAGIGGRRRLRGLHEA